MISLLDRISLISFILAILIAMVAMSLSWRTELLEQNILQLQKDIRKNQENFKILQTEWSRITSPENLKPLVDRYLDLKQSNGYHVIHHLSELPLSRNESSKIASRLQTP